MAKSGFQIDRNNLGKSAQDAFAEHTAKRMSYAEWKSVTRTINRLQQAETFRTAYGEALHNGQHPDHEKRLEELQAIYETAYPEEPNQAGTDPWTQAG